MLMGMQNDTVTWQDSVAISYTANPTFVIKCSNCIPWDLPIWIENLHTSKTGTRMLMATLFILTKI